MVEDQPNPRPPQSERELRYWLENMHVYHRFSLDEISAATGLADREIRSAIERFKLRREDRPERRSGERLTVLPYPGGRHPRLGFFEGAIGPQRETKISVFTPWDPTSYVVVDLPEAVWSNLGLTYLAHTHVPTIWSEQDVEIEKLEWQVNDDGSLVHTRRLPNGISFTASAVAEPDVVKMELALTNGTDEPLDGLRNQICVMLGYAAGFNEQSSDNKVMRKPYVACRSQSGKRWIITAWEPCHRPWANPHCPCMHSDPKLADCPAGQTVKAVGYLWFYEGEDIDAELQRLASQTGWPVGAEPQRAKPAAK